jgi:hypothetical protein
MAQIQLSVVVPSQSKKTQVEVPDNVPTERLVRALVTKMGLPLVNERNQPINYRLGYSREGNDTEINPEATLSQAGVQNNDALWLHPDMRAGAGSFIHARR